MELEVLDLGLIEYSRSLMLQDNLLQQTIAGEHIASLILCSHFPVITRGRNASSKSLLAKPETLRQKGIEVIETRRGGDITYHGPGQLTVYPVLNLAYFRKDIRWYLRMLEESVITTLSEFGITGRSQPGLTGVWVDNSKICSIGIAIKNWVTFHGLSINVTKDDLENFQLIRPCGMDIQMCSMESVLNKSISLNMLKQTLTRTFTSVFTQRDTQLSNRGTPNQAIGSVSLGGDSLSFELLGVPN